jgi:tRNA A-37 threonylcarbamoyl transferase component Bud32
MEERLVGNYRITRLLSEGGMGIVYAAEHKLLGSPAVIKLLLDERARSPQDVQRFFTEARAATAIRHPGIVEIYDFGCQDDGTAFIAMELLEGENLESRIRARGRLPVGQAVQLAMQVASALAAAHDHGIVHRDLKPPNIFLVPDPQVMGGERIKLLDFGIAKVSPEEGAGQPLTQAGVVMGTPSYMAPEQCLGASRVDARADLYSMGCILFEMMVGRPPFAGSSSMDTISAHLRQTPPRPSDLVAEIPAQLDAIVLHLLEKDPDRRYQRAGELEVELGALLAAGKAIPRLPAPVRRKRVSPWIAAMGVLVVAATVGAGLALRSPQAPAAAPMAPRPAPRPALAPARPAPPPAPPRFEPLVDAPPAHGDDVARWIIRSQQRAQVFHDEELVGDTPLVVTMTRDASRVELVRVHLYDHVDQEIALEASGSGERMVELVPYTKITFITRPPGAVIHAPSGESIGKTPGEVGVPPGTDSVAFLLRRDGYRDHRVEVVPDRAHKIRIRLERAPRGDAAGQRKEEP